ncbi:MAG: DUF3012 domain-containing protein [Proteobacteria bacterium]|jgi:hypothetical protein|nr:DUF3012 domain-containing protein [Pseudomonadota bacterium]
MLHINQTTFRQIKQPTALLTAMTAILLMVGCADKPGSEGWCNALSDRDKSSWTGEEARTYARYCILESTTVGSDAWCNNLEETPKGDWTTQEVADYAQYCTVKKMTGD